MLLAIKIFPKKLSLKILIFAAGLLTNISFFVLGGESFAAEMTDFNVWNRPLSIIEIEEYSFACNNSSDFVKNSKPELVSWYDLNITRQGNETRQIRVPKEKLCKKLQDFNEKTMIFYPLISSYADAYSVCKYWKGDLPFPINSSHMEMIASKSREQLIKSSCTDRIWVSIVKSKQNNSKWIYDMSGGFELEVKFPGFEIPESKIDERCSYYDTNLKKFKAKNCYHSLCFFCQIPEDRLVYRIRGNAPYECSLDDKYILSNDEFGYVVLFGLDGKNIISKPWSWTFQNLFSKQVEGYLNNGDLLNPIGFQYLNCMNRNITMPIKLTNVSLISKIISIDRYVFHENKLKKIFL